jgi:hypothetical protein
MIVAGGIPYEFGVRHLGLASVVRAEGKLKLKYKRERHLYEKGIDNRYNRAGWFVSCRIAIK